MHNPQQTREVPADNLLIPEYLRIMPDESEQSHFQIDVAYPCGPNQLCWDQTSPDRLSAVTPFEGGLF
jgi:hypothetical protein